MVATKFLAVGNHKPSVAKPGDAGIDLKYNSEIVLEIYPSTLYKIHTGVFVEIYKGQCGIIFERSGLGSKHGVIIHGRVIDEGYRGEIIVIMSINNVNTVVESGIKEHKSEILKPLTFKPGDKVAQMIVVPKNSELVEVAKLEELSDSVRGDTGLGSSGR